MIIKEPSACGSIIESKDKTIIQYLLRVLFFCLEAYCAIYNAYIN